MKVPFFKPLIDDDVIAEVNDTLTRTTWLTTGPKVRLLEQEIEKLLGIANVLCVNSWTSGAMLALKWYGVGPDDEVIIPAYTYSATALCAMNLGAKVVMVDVKDDFTLDPEKLLENITNKTKAIIPVDIGGWPCDYDAIKSIVQSEEVKGRFVAENEVQTKLGRPLLVSDSAHSIGALYNGKPIAHAPDMTVLSFHSVKNITAGEGGGICLNLPADFDSQELYQELKVLSLNGQTKTAYEKNKVGGWRYDIIYQGLKINMPDICAAIALAQIKKYKEELLPERLKIFDRYNQNLSKYEWAIMQGVEDGGNRSSCHLYLVRIKGITEDQRDQMIQYLSENQVGVNVHYIPMAMLKLFKSMGYKIEDYPKTYELYANQITLPIYNNLTLEQVDHVCVMLDKAYQSLGIS